MSMLGTDVSMLGHDGVFVRARALDAAQHGALVAPPHLHLI